MRAHSISADFLPLFTSPVLPIPPLLIAFAPSFSLGSASYFLFYPFLDTSLSQRRVRRGFSASCYALGLCLVAIALVAQEHSRVLLGCVCSYQVALVQYRRGTLSLSWRDVNHIWEGFPFFSPCAMERGGLYVSFG